MRTCMHTGPQHARAGPCRVPRSDCPFNPGCLGQLIAGTRRHDFNVPVCWVQYAVLLPPDPSNAFLKCNDTAGRGTTGNYLGATMLWSTIGVMTTACSRIWSCRLAGHQSHRQPRQPYQVENIAGLPTSCTSHSLYRENQCKRWAT